MYVCMYVFMYVRTYVNALQALFYMDKVSQKWARYSELVDYVRLVCGLEDISYKTQE